jgi:proteasome lid subunit RPN8/RPN11
MTAALELPLAFQQQLRDESLRAFPRECCGLLEGTVDSSVARVIAMHPMPNIANEPDHFEIDPASHIGLLRSLRGTRRTIIGCYHSHPNGRAEPSGRDCESAIEPHFFWLICSVECGAQSTKIVAFVSTASSLSPVPIVNTSGTAGVPPVSP